MSDTSKPSLLKQLLGAVGGTAVALVLYYGYQAASPLVTGYLLPSDLTEMAAPEIVVTASSAAAENRFAAIGDKARDIADTMEVAYLEQTVTVASSAASSMQASSLTVSDEVALRRAARDIERDVDAAAALVAQQIQPSSAAVSVKTLSSKAAIVKPAVAIAAHEGAPNLPSSGRASMAFSFVFAFIAAAVMHPKMRARMHACFAR